MAFFHASKTNDFIRMKSALRVGANIHFSFPLSSAVPGFISISHLAAQAGNIELLNFLFEGGHDFDSKDLNWGIPPFFFAVMAGNMAAIHFFVENGADVNRQSLVGETPLYIAAFKGHQRVVEFVIHAILFEAFPYFLIDAKSIATGERSKPSGLWPKWTSRGCGTTPRNESALGTSSKFRQV